MRITFWGGFEGVRFESGIVDGATVHTHVERLILDHWMDGQTRFLRDVASQMTSC